MRLGCEWSAKVDRQCRAFADKSGDARKLKHWSRYRTCEFFITRKREQFSMREQGSQFDVQITMSHNL